MKQHVLMVAILSVAINSISLISTIEAYDKICFYEILQSQQKYSVDASPKSSSTYQIQISNMVEGRWNNVYFKQSKNPYQSSNIHKLASAQSTYSFCFKNVEQNVLKIHINIQSGLELLEFQMLPDKSDSENLERELSWLESQKKKLLQTLERMEGLRANSEGLSNLMNNKMIGFAIVGLLSIIVVNLMFYRELKKTFKDRKLI